MSNPSPASSIPLYTSSYAQEPLPHCGTIELADQLEDAEAVLAFFKTGFRHTGVAEFSGHEQRGAGLIIDGVLERVSGVRSLLAEKA